MDKRENALRSKDGDIFMFGGSNLFGAIDTYLKRCPMTQADHYREQANRANRLARAVKDPEAATNLPKWPRNSGFTPNGSKNPISGRLSPLRDPPIR